ncbi:MAG: transcriptional repressor LexA, partial [Terriglobia bacterium]
AKPVHTPKRSNRPTVQPKTQASIDDQHSEAILGKLGEKSRLRDCFRVRRDPGTMATGAKSVLHLRGPRYTIHLFSMDRELTKPQGLVLGFLEERSKNGMPPPTYREICRRFGYRSPKAAFDHVVALEKKGYVMREKGFARGLHLVRKSTGIPLLGRIAAGLPDEALTTTDERLNVDPTFYGIRDRSRAFALSVTGDSMIGRHILEGDIVLLERAAVPQDGDIVAALIDNESTLKTLVHKKEGKVWLRAENPVYPELIPVLDLQVQGVVRAVIRSLRK